MENLPITRVGLPLSAIAHDKRIEPYFTVEYLTHPFIKLKVSRLRFRASDVGLRIVKLSVGTKIVQGGNEAWIDIFDKETTWRFPVEECGPVYGAQVTVHNPTDKAITLHSMTFWGMPR